MVAPYSPLRNNRQQTLDNVCYSASRVTCTNLSVKYKTRHSEEFYIVKV